MRYKCELITEFLADKKRIQWSQPDGNFSKEKDSEGIKGSFKKFPSISTFDFS